MDVYFLNNFFGVLICGGEKWKGLFLVDFFSWVKTESKICLTYDRGKKLVVKLKRI